MARKRTGKFYSKHEKEIMEKFGLKGTPQSGAGFLIKEDGYNENVLCQLKSTDSQSFKLTLDDLDKLEYHSIVEHKIPVFIVDFMGRDEQYLILKPENLVDLSEYLKLPKSRSETKIEPQNGIVDSLLGEQEKVSNKKMIKSSSNKKLLNDMKKERDKMYAGKKSNRKK